MPERKAVFSAQAPQPVTAYSQAIAWNGALYCSGQIPIDPETGQLAELGMGDSARLCLRHLAAVCAAAGTRLEDSLRVTIYTTDLGRYAEMNEAYAEFFAAVDDPPARVAVEVKSLPLGAPIELEAVVPLPS